MAIFAAREDHIPPVRVLDGFPAGFACHAALGKMAREYLPCHVDDRSEHLQAAAQHGRTGNTGNGAHDRRNRALDRTLHPVLTGSRTTGQGELAEFLE